MGKESAQISVDPRDTRVEGPCLLVVLSGRRPLAFIMVGHAEEVFGLSLLWILADYLFKLVYDAVYMLLLQFQDQLDSSYRIWMLFPRGLRPERANHKAHRTDAFIRQWVREHIRRDIDRVQNSLLIDNFEEPHGPIRVVTSLRHVFNAKGVSLLLHLPAIGELTGCSQTLAQRPSCLRLGAAERQKNAQES